VTWNHRLVRFKNPDGGYRYEFKEVYYHDDGTLMAYGDPFLWGESIAEVQELADQLVVAAAKPSVYEEDFGERNEVE
jgi:hypothetical protein